MRSHLIVILTVFVLSLVVFTQARSLLKINSVDLQYAVSCSTGYAIQPPPGKTFTEQCVQAGTQMYAGDSRYTFFVVPGSMPSNLTFIQTENAGLKDLPTLSWSINFQSSHDLYIYYRKIPGQSVPSWIQSHYTKMTTDDFSNLNQFVLRKNEQGLIGVYDIWKRNSNSAGVVNFGPASDSTVTAYSMYILAIKGNTVFPSSSATITPSPSATVTPSPTATTNPSRSPSPTPTSTPIPTGGTGNLPAQVLNLTNWKITLPSPLNGSSPTEIKQPALATYTDEWFKVNSSRNGVIFRAPVNGAHTSGSKYPRSELREMVSNGTFNAAWNNTSGTHTMTLDQAITAVPQTKKHVVAGQIHDADDDVIVIRLELPNLYVNVGTNPPGGDQHVYTLDSNYTLGKRFTVRFVASGGKTMIYYNGAATPAYTLTRAYSGAYFKTGAYTQSNCSTEASGLCSANNYGEVVVYNAVVTH